MFWINVVTAAAVGAATMIGWVRLRRHQSAASLSEARTALKTCGQLLELLRHLQQHRGMCGAWLSGDTSFESRIADKRREIKSTFADLVNAAAVETDRPHSCFTANDLSLFRFKWLSLCDKLDDMSVEQGIAQHSHMITTVLHWLAAYGEARIDSPFGRMLPAGAARNFSYHLPALTECLGQARVIGASIAARGRCSPVARVRMMFLTARAESLMKQSAVATGLGNPGANAVQAVEELTWIIRRYMLASEGVTVSADSYFTTATNAIDAVFALARTLSESLDRELANPAAFGRAWFAPLLPRGA